MKNMIISAIVLVAPALSFAQTFLDEKAHNSDAVVLENQHYNEDAQVPFKDADEFPAEEWRTISQEMLTVQPVAANDIQTVEFVDGDLKITVTIQGPVENPDSSLWTEIILKHAADQLQLSKEKLIKSYQVVHTAEEWSENH